jgi:MFS family permease
MFGKRKFFILGAIVFTVASAIAGFSTNIGLLIFSRTLQGVGLAIVFPVTMVLAALAFPEHKRGLAIGITGAVSGLAQAIGPTFGGVVMQYLNWHWIFVIDQC